MINYTRNQKVIRRWIQNLNRILKYQTLGLYNNIEIDKILSRIIEVIEEYDDLIFEED